jgi:hypothetical protein
MGGQISMLDYRTGGSEGSLLDVLLPEFAQNVRIYLCQYFYISRSFLYDNWKSPNEW